MIACYDLQHRLPTYDFFCWLTHVKLLGASAITISHGRKYFMRKKWTVADTRERVDNYILPGPALAGLPCRIGDDGDREIGSHLVSELWRDIVQHGGEMPRLRSVLLPVNVAYTVTIRDQLYKPERNSDGPLWREFAKKIGAHVFEDHRIKPVKLHERVALMAGARMNFGVANGPVSLLTWTRYPVCIFCDPALGQRDFERQEIRVGDQLPWFLPHQRFVWRKPTMQSLMTEVEGFT